MVSDSNKSRYHTTPLTYVVFFIYCFLSIFEGYTSSIFGAVSKYYILLFIAYLLISGWVFKVQKGHYVLFVWLTFYIASLIWTPNFSQAMLYFYTIVGMTALLMIVLGMQFDSVFVSRIIEVMALFSLLLGILGLFFSTSYMGVAASRQVLSLFGVQIDPNNLVALYAIGAGMGLFYAFFSQKKTIAKITYGILSLVNMYGIFMTGSRSGIIVLTSILIILLLHKSGYVSKGKNIFRRIIYSIFIIIGITILLKYLPKEVWLRISGQDSNLAFTNSTGRTERWMTGIRLWWNTNPLFGCGWGAYECHGTFFTFLIDTGIFGSVLFWGFVISVLVKCIHGRHTEALLMMATGLVPGFFLGAQNKRFFWNAIIIPVMVLNQYRRIEKYDTDAKTNSSKEVYEREIQDKTVSG